MLVNSFVQWTFRSQHCYFLFKLVLFVKQLKEDVRLALGFYEHV